MADEFTLYWFPFSLYSIMSRFDLEVAKSLDPDNAPKFRTKLVDLHHEGEVAEDYLKINPRGSVPAVTSPELSSSLIDSRDIADWLCERHPQLLPLEHKETIDRLMDLLYAFHAKALCTPEEKRIHGVPNFAAKKLESKGISEEYRRSLEIKSVYQDQHRGNAFEPEVVEQTEADAIRFSNCLSDVILSERQRHGRSTGPWIFGAKPTIIDAHAAPLLARLLDVGRPEFLQGVLKEYVEGVKGTEEWKRTRGPKGWSTWWDPSMGPVKDMEEW